MSFTKIKSITLIFFFVLIFVGCVSLEAHARMATGVSISPVRQEIKDGQRYATVSLLNRATTTPVAYSISLVTLRMQENGKLYEPKAMTKREQIAKSMVKFSPKRASIPANGKQVVRLLARRPAELPEGEYMVYMRVTPSVQIEKNTTTPTKPMDHVSTSITTVVGMSSPVIIYQGNPTSTSKLAGATLGVDEFGAPAIKVFIDRSGNRSSYPGVKIYSTAGGQKKLIAKRPRIPIFLPLKRRTQDIVFEKGVSFTGGPILIEMWDYEDPDKKIIDTMEVNL